MLKLVGSWVCSTNSKKSIGPCCLDFHLSCFDSRLAFGFPSFQKKTTVASTHWYLVGDIFSIFESVGAGSRLSLFGYSRVSSSYLVP